MSVADVHGYPQAVMSSAVGKLVWRSLWRDRYARSIPSLGTDHLVHGEPRGRTEKALSTDVEDRKKNSKIT